MVVVDIFSEGFNFMKFLQFWNSEGYNVLAKIVFLVFNFRNLIIKQVINLINKLSLDA